jgi:hypothetical protein
MSIYIVSTTASAAVATNGTLSFSYPAGMSAGYFNANTFLHRLSVRGMQSEFVFGTGFTLSFGATSITATYLGATPIPAGSQVFLQLESSGQNDGRALLDSAFAFNARGVNRASLGGTWHVKFGSVATVSATAVVNAATVLAAGVVALATPFVADVARALSTVSSNAADTTQTITIRGFDEYGVAMTETGTLNGTTSVSFRKAFATVVSYQASAALAGTLSIGITKTLGLPVTLSQTGWVLRELADGVSASGGSYVAAATALPSATTGDVRGTWTPSGTPNGTINYELIVYTADPTHRGLPQFA